MSRPDHNLLVPLDALFAKGSVAGDTQRLRLSPSAMSRALTRLRDTTGDPLLPRALKLRERVSQVVQIVEAVLRFEEMFNLKRP